MSDLKRIEDKIDKMGGDITDIKVTQAEQHVVLSEHIKRTAMLEDDVRPMRTSFMVGTLAISSGALIVTIIEIIKFVKGS